MNQSINIHEAKPASDNNLKNQDDKSTKLRLRIPGRLAGQIQISDDFDKPDEELIDLFYRD